MRRSAANDPQTRTPNSTGHHHWQSNLTQNRPRLFRAERRKAAAELSSTKHASRSFSSIVLKARETAFLEDPSDLSTPTPFSLSLFCYPYRASKDTGRGHDRYVAELVDNTRSETKHVSVSLVDTGFAKN